jgi:DNA-binding CsgD family transcriptional regulator
MNESLRNLKGFLSDFKLTPTQFAVAVEMASTPDKAMVISERLFVSVRTIKFHSTDIYRKCGVASRLELIFKCLPYIMEDLMDLPLSTEDLDPIEVLPAHEHHEYTTDRRLKSDR